MSWPWARRKTATPQSTEEPGRERSSVNAESRSRPLLHRCTSMHIDAAALAPPEFRPAHEHARLLVEWLRGDGGRVGWIRWHELARCHQEMCLELQLEPTSWIAVARALGWILPQPKRYTGSPRERIWFVGAAQPSPATLDVDAPADPPVLPRSRLSCNRSIQFPKSHKISRIPGAHGEIEPLHDVQGRGLSLDRSRLAATLGNASAGFAGEDQKGPGDHLEYPSRSRQAGGDRQIGRRAPR